MTEEQVRGDSPIQMVGRTFRVEGATGDVLQLVEVRGFGEPTRRYHLTINKQQFPWRAYLAFGPVTPEPNTATEFELAREAPATGPSLPGGPERATPEFDFRKEEASAGRRMPQDHLVTGRKILEVYGKAVEGGVGEGTLTLLLAEAQVHATLAIATELERHRMAGWGRPA